jgi:regulatory protein
MRDDPQFEKARQRAFRLLARRAQSKKELKDKLIDRGFEMAVVDRVVKMFTEDGYLNDETFARDWARHLARNRHYGNRRIEMSLAGKGIAKDLIARAIAEARGEIEEREGIRKVLQKKLRGRKPGGLDRAEKRRLAQSLALRGYSWPLIIEALGKKQEGLFDDIE